jgi:hypothetical protein
MKDVFGSIPLVASSHPSSSSSSNTNDGSICTPTSSTSVNEARAPCVSIQNDQRLLSHEDSKFS